MSRIENIKEKLAVLHPLKLDIVDESHRHAGHAGARSGGGHFLLQIISADFVGKNKMERHRMIYALLQDFFQIEIHALTIESYTEDEYKQIVKSKEKA